MYDRCGVCGGFVVRDLYFATSDTQPTAMWLGVCGCDFRKWRWRSATGEPPWNLVGLTTGHPSFGAGDPMVSAWPLG